MGLGLTWREGCRRENERTTSLITRVDGSGSSVLGRQDQSSGEFHGEGWTGFDKGW